MHIKDLHIQNYKSIKDLKIKTNRLNVFIGEPNAGKSNILEALSFFSINAMDDNFRKFLRYKSTGNLFYDSVLDKPINIKTNVRKFKLEYAKNDAGALMNHFTGVYYEKDEELETLKKNPQGVSSNFTMQHDGTIRNNHGINMSTHTCAYIYKRIEKFEQNFRNFLKPPHGNNIPNLLLSSSELKKMVSSFFREKGYKINLKPEDNDLEIAKEEDEVIYSYPYMTISETLQRIVFILLAIETNKNATLIFDEPEANTFPFYTKYVAERIAQDKTNQYFITTHNPYLLLNIIEKSPSKELNVFVTTMKNYQTKAHLLTKQQVKEVIELQHEVFFNLDKFTK
ncbi:MAG: AAA family ATPase [Chitinophagaceae bacterium]